MNTAMYVHPVTEKQIRVLEDEWGVKEGESNSAEGTDGEGKVVHCQGWFEVLRPIEKSLACGDVGSGAMMEWTEIVKITKQRLGLPE